MNNQKQNSNPITKGNNNNSSKLPIQTKKSDSKHKNQNNSNNKPNNKHINCNNHSQYSNNDSNNKLKGKIKNNNISEYKAPNKDKLKNSLESGRVGPDGKHLYHQNYNKFNNYNTFKNPKTNLYNRDYFIESEYDDKDGFIDDSGCNKIDKRVADFISGIEKMKKIKKKNEYKGEIIESNYDRIQAEEAYTKKVAYEEDKKEFEKIKMEEMKEMKKKNNGK